MENIKMADTKDLQAVKDQFAITIVDIKGEVANLKGFEEIEKYFRKQDAFWEKAVKGKGAPQTLGHSLSTTRNVLNLCNQNGICSL
jgi:hypothetical protein